MTTRKRGRPRKYGRKTAKRRSVISPMAHLARKVQGIDTRLNRVESEVGTMPKRFVRRKKKKHHRLGTLEDGARGHEYWASGE